MALLLGFILGSVTLYAVPKFRDDLRKYFSKLGGILTETIFILFIGALWLVLIETAVEYLR